jgi:hypothetical protein
MFNIWVFTILAILKADKYILSDDMPDLKVDTLEATDDCMRFCSDTEYIHVLCCESEK